MNPPHDKTRSVPRVSIIVPVYGRVRLLPATLASIAGQTYTDTELILCDDGSDPPLERWIRWLAPDARYVRQERNAGPAAARNTAIRHARGQYLVFVDSDDIWSPETLARHVHALDENPDAVLSFVDTVRTGLAYWTRKPVPTDPQDQRRRLAVSNFIYTLSQVAVRRKTFDAVGGFDETLRNCEDQKFYAQCLSHGTLLHVDYPGVDKREAGGNISRSLAVRFDAIARYSAWAAERFSARSRGSLTTASACVALKTMADPPSGAWWRYWLETTLRHPVRCLTHRPWYFALAVKAYRFGCRRTRLLRRAELARAKRGPHYLILHRTDTDRNTRLLETFVQLATRDRPELLGAVVPTTNDNDALQRYEDLGLGILSPTWVSLRGYPRSGVPLLVISESDTTRNRPAEESKTERIIEAARSRNASVYFLPNDEIDAGDLVVSAHGVAGGPIQPDPAALITMPENLRADRDRLERISATVRAARMTPVFLPTEGSWEPLPDASALCFDSPVDLRSYATLVQRAALVITPDPDQHRLARFAGRSVVFLRDDASDRSSIEMAEAECRAEEIDELLDRLPALLEASRRDAEKPGLDEDDRKDRIDETVDALLQKIAG